MSKKFMTANLKLSGKMLPIALILLLSLPIVMTNMQIANAFNSQWDAFAFVEVAPNPVEVNKQLIVSVRVDKTSPTAVGPRDGDHFILFANITKPDGTTETQGPYTSDSTSGAYFFYTPTMIGNYTFTAIFPGQWINGSYTTTSSRGQWTNTTGQPLISENRWYKPSTSSPLVITVQQQPIPPYPSVPLPTDYWTRPIYGENKGWHAVADNWLMQGYDYVKRSYTACSSASAFAPYTSAPRSAHILWTRPAAFGGIVGGQFGDKVHYTGLMYEQYYAPIIIHGKIIYVETGCTSTQPYGTRCIDLYTGKDVWYLNDVAISFAQTVAIETPNEHGILSYLWSTSGSSTNGTWKMYDAFTARHILTIINVPTGTSSYGISTTFGPNGEIFNYILDNAKNRLILWNSTKAIMEDPANRGGTYDYFSPTLGSVIDGRRGIQWNVSIPDIPGSPTIAMMNVKDGYILASLQDSSVYPNIFEYVAFPATLEKLPNGNYPDHIDYLWFKNRTDILMTAAALELASRNIGSNVYTQFDAATTQLYGYDIRTGEQIWTSDPITTSWGVFTRHSIIAYGTVYTAGYDGHVRGFNATTGKLIWDFYEGSAGYETPYGTYPQASGLTVADGIVFAANDEHTPDSVMWRGGKLWAIDAMTGQCLWNISGWLRVPIVSDGYLTSCNALDNQIYTFGKGPSATTVSAPQSGVSVGNPIAITGTVTDQSPGQPGTPCISDADMSTWMEYLHMQKPFPENAAGVPVKITAIAPDGTLIDIGTTTSDNGGSFGIAFTPTMTGKYQIKATFDGTESYGSSYTTTYLVVGSTASSPSTTTMPSITETPTGAETPTKTPSSPTVAPQPESDFPTETLLIATAAIIIVIVVVAVALMLRKRK